MNNELRILSVDPHFAIPGGEVSLNCATPAGPAGDIEVFFDETRAQVTAASRSRIMVQVPKGISGEDVEISLHIGSERSDSASLSVGEVLCGEMHMVANPAIDPNDNSIVLTRSGTRGQELPETLFRFEDGSARPISANVMNPTGIAFDGYGKLVVTNRADGEVIQINNDDDTITIARDLGVATGIAFDKSGKMYIGDRGGSVLRIEESGESTEFASIEPSVSAFHMAFSVSGDLLVAAPGLCSHDVIHFVSPDGKTGIFYKGLGRPQGIAVEENGDVYVAACLRGRHGIVKISSDGSNAELWLTGTGIVGQCFDSDGRLVVATADTIYRLNTKIFGSLLG